MAILAYPEVPLLQVDLIDDGAGYYPNKRAFEVDGFVDNVDNVRVDVTNIGGTTPQLYVFPPAGGIQMQIQSTSANDDGNPVGTGVRTLHIHYLDANYAVQEESITLNGIGAVTTVATNILRINGMHTTTVGSAGAAVGNITLTNVGATVVYARIDIGFNTIRNAVFTIPAGKQGYITHWSAFSGSAGTHYTQITLRTTAHENIRYDGVFMTSDNIGAENSGASIGVDIPIHVPEKTDIKVSCVSDGAAANAQVSAHFSGWYE